MYTEYVRQFERVIGKRGWDCGPTSFRFPCPVCWSPSKNEYTLSIHPKYGCWNCFRCIDKGLGNEGWNGKGSWKGFARYMNDDFSNWPDGSQGVEDCDTDIASLSLPEVRKIWVWLFSTLLLSSTHEKCMAQRCIDAKAAGMVSVPDNILPMVLDKFGEETATRASLVCKPEGRPLMTSLALRPGRLLVPYYYSNRLQYFFGYSEFPKQNINQTDEQYEELKGRWVKYAYLNSLYKQRVYGDPPKGSEFVVITEGPLKAICAIQLGLPSLGLPGMNSKHDSVVSEVVKKSIENVIILFDTDRHSQYLIDYASDCLARKLLRNNVKVFRCCLPSPENPLDSKEDLDSFVAKYGAQRLEDIICSSRPYAFKEDEDDNGDSEDVPTGDDIVPE